MVSIFILAFNIDNSLMSITSLPITLAINCTASGFSHILNKWYHSDFVRFIDQKIPLSTASSKLVFSTKWRGTRRFVVGWLFIQQVNIIIKIFYSMLNQDASVGKKTVVCLKRNIRVSQKFCNILVRASLRCVYHMTEEVPAVKRYQLCLVVSW